MGAGTSIWSLSEMKDRDGSRMIPICKHMAGECEISGDLYGI